jgi:hypothetical protein
MGRSVAVTGFEQLGGWDAVVGEQVGFGAASRSWQMAMVSSQCSQTTAQAWLPSGTAHHTIAAQ